MVKKVFIEGMSCGHCAARIEKALLNLQDVSQVKVNLGGKYAELISQNELDEQIVKSAIDEAGFHLISVN